MQIEKQEMVEFANLVATAVVNALEKMEKMEKPTVQSANKKPEKSAYQKTEQLLYNYRGFKKIVQERMDEIADLRRYGVPQKCGTVGERVQGGTVQKGIMLPEESLEIAIRNVEDSIQGTVAAINLIDKCMAALKNDPYYKVLEMRYFDGRTLEDIGVYLKCDHTTISRNKSRLVKELAMRLFPDEVMNEYMS